MRSLDQKVTLLDQSLEQLLFSWEQLDGRWEHRVKCELSLQRFVCIILCRYRRISADFSKTNTKENTHWNVSDLRATQNPQPSMWKLPYIVFLNKDGFTCMFTPFKVMDSLMQQAILSGRKASVTDVDFYNLQEGHSYKHRAQGFNVKKTKTLWYVVQTHSKSIIRVYWTLIVVIIR